MYRSMKSRRVDGFTGIPVQLILWILKKGTYRIYSRFVQVEHECKFRECSHQHEQTARDCRVESGDIWQETIRPLFEFYEELNKKTSIKRKKVDRGDRT